VSDQSLAALRGVSKRYADVLALDELDLEVRAGELLAVLGPNGAGKSTAISMLLGLRQPDAGEAVLFGKAPKSIDARRNIGVMMQEVGQPPELTVRELVELTSRYYPRPLAMSETVELSGIGAIANRRYGQLSGGQKRLAQFAISVCGAPRLLFLDEPTTHLDVDARETLWSAVRQLVDRGTSVLLTTHYIEEAEALATRVAVIAQGRCVATGTVQEMRRVVVHKHIECMTKIRPQEVMSWPEVEAATFERGLLRVTTRDAEGVARRLLVADPSLCELEVRRASLADALKLLAHGEVR